MAHRRFFGLLIVALIFLLPPLDLAARQPDDGSGATSQPIAGRLGGAERHSVVNFMDLARQEASNPQAAERLPTQPFLSLPEKLPVADQQAGQPEPAPALPQVGLAPDSPPAAASFLGLDDSGTSIPPDTHGAVGPNHVMTTLNTQVRIQNRTGGVISTVTLNAFWSSVAGGSGTFDPKVLYDPFNNRWMFVACDDSRSATSGILMGVSQTSDPTGNWNLFKIDGDAANLAWVDYPSMGFNKDWIVVQMNMFNVSNDAFNRSHIYAFKKADLYANLGATHTLLQSSTIGGTQAPALTYDNTLSTVYLLQNWNGNSGGSGFVRLYSITGAVGSEVLTPVAFISTPNPWDTTPPGGTDFAPQLGSAQKIQNNDARMQNLVYRNGSLWGTQTVFLPAGGATRSAVQWWQINPLTNGVTQRARVEDPTGANFYAYPSIAVNRNDDVLIGYSRFSATQYASANYSFRQASDPLNTTQADTVLKAGQAPYYKTFSGTRNRWGDYSSTVVDPVNDTDMWTVQEYAALPSGGTDRWGTWWGKIVPPGVTVTPVSGLTTTEAGGTATFSVVLASQPSATVTINLSSSDTTEGTVAPAALTFSTANWNVAQTATVTGVDDVLIDGDIAYTIITAATSSDASYNGITVADVAVTNTDNDTATAGVTVTPISGLTTTEAGGTATFTVRLNSQPAADVVVSLSSSDTTEGTVAPAALTFTSVNWNTAQTATVTGVDDALVDGNIAYTIVTAATSSDTSYNGIAVADVGVTNTDNDTASVTVTPISGLTTTEAGGTATFTVRLNSQPTATVTINLSSSDTTEGTVAPAALTFSTANWNVAQTATVTGVDDALVDGNIAYTIVTAATSSDTSYNGITVADVAVTNTDNDTASVTVTPISGLTTTEAGGTATFTVRLNSQPTATVTINLSSSDTTEGTVAPAALTFSTANWNVAQTATVTGVDDALVDGNIAYTIVTAATSSDTSYNGITVADVAVTNTDNDTATAGVTVTPISGLTTTEAGGTATFTVRLNSQPAADVVVSLSSSDTTEGTVAPAALTFSTANWNVAQTATVTGVDDALVDGNIAYTIVTAATSSDTSYNGIAVADVGVTNTDNDTASVTVTPISGLTTTEAGGTATFTVRLNSQPTATVTINLSSSDTTEGTVAPAALTFSTANWNVAQTATVTGVDDALDDGDIAYTIITAATSSDTSYNGIAVADVAVTNTDNDDPIVFPVLTLNAGSVMVSETAGTLVISATLSTAFNQVVTVNYATSNGTALAGSDYTNTSGTLTFQPGQTVRTISIPITNDVLNEPDETFSLALNTPVNATLGAPASVMVTIKGRYLNYVPMTMR